MRNYPRNSPLAAGRVLALMLIADGNVCASEIRVLKQLNAEGVTILLVEQMAMMALSVAHRAYVIQNGRVILEGPSARVASDPEVVRAYLGGAAAH